MGGELHLDIDTFWSLGRRELTRELGYRGTSLINASAKRYIQADYACSLSIDAEQPRHLCLQ